MALESYGEEAWLEQVYIEDMPVGLKYLSTPG